MATFSWQRAFGQGISWNSGPNHRLIGSLTSGQTIIISRVQWGFAGTTSTTIVPASMMGNVAALGLVTTIGNRTETPPDPITAPGNAAPPAQRWLYWSVRAPTVSSWDAGAGVATWTQGPPQDVGETEAQVLAPTAMGTGNTLNLWVVQDSVGLWDATGLATVWFAVQTLIRTP